LHVECADHFIAAAQRQYAFGTGLGQIRVLVVHQIFLNQIDDARLAGLGHQTHKALLADPEAMATGQHPHPGGAACRPEHGPFP